MRREKKLLRRRTRRKNYINNAVINDNQVEATPIGWKRVEATDWASGGNIEGGEKKKNNKKNQEEKEGGGR